MSIRYRYNPRQLSIFSKQSQSVDSTKNGVKKSQKSDIEELKDYIRKLFIEVKLLRSEVRQLKQMTR